MDIPTNGNMININNMKGIEVFSRQELDALREKLEDQLTEISKTLNILINKRAELLNEIKPLEREISSYEEIRDLLIKVLRRNY